MYNEPTAEFVADQGYYYPTPASYSYYCTGLESPGKWEDHRMIFSVDGQEVQYTGGQIENSPYSYYTPSYSTQSLYNPYNPYIPGATGIDGQFVGAQQYYTTPPYQNPVPSTAYMPYFVQPDIGSLSLSDSVLESSASAANRSEGRGGSKNNLTSASFPRYPSKPTTTISSTKVTGGPNINIGQSKQPAMHGDVSSSGLAAYASARVFQGTTASASIHPTDNISTGKRHIKAPLPGINSISDFGSSDSRQTAGNKLRPKFNGGKGVNGANVSQDALGLQNRVPRTDRSKNQLVLKPYTTKAGDIDAQGNIVINIDQYNKDNLPTNYPNAKFFVIKSYSEDDVHKSIKYNVWSSTLHGNRKLQSVYQDAQKVASEKSDRCPIFLFFSVNASGQFCGVAEMVGSVDFHKDMDFWQQDKWSGCFPVKWHIVKDVSNNYFRHIILETNENKPVTNSRDTQEIMQSKGQEMLKIFKEHTSQTSVFDDFMYYENRQKMMQEEKARTLYNGFRSPFLVPELDSARNFIVDNSDRISKHYGHNSSRHTASLSAEPVHVNYVVKSNTNEIGDQKKSASSANLKVAESKPVAESTDVVTVGSVPIKVNGFGESANVLTVGTIPLDSSSLQKRVG